MNSRQRITVVFAMMSLSVLMLFFQNCSSGNGLFSDESLTDGFITNPPVIFASKNSACTYQATSFSVSEEFFICIQNAGVAPLFCRAVPGGCSPYETVSSSSGWSGLTGNWVKAFSYARSNGFAPGYQTVYAMHTDDHSSTGQVSFTVTP